MSDDALPDDALPDDALPDDALPDDALPDDAPDSAKLDDDAVRHVAKLARLDIADADVHRISEQLTGILTYVSKIAEVDTEGVEPVAHAVPMENVLREDKVGPMLSVDQALQNAPDREPPFFKVPKVIGGDEDSAG